MNYGRLEPGKAKAAAENKNGILYTSLYVVYGCINEEMQYAKKQHYCVGGLQVSLKACSRHDKIN